MDLAAITERCLNGTGLSREEAVALTGACLPLDELYPHTSRIREHYFGKTIQFCTIVNARSGTCSEDCKYCAQSAHYNTNAPTYTLMEPETILDAARAIQQTGASSFSIVTSGPGVSEEELESICRAIRLIREHTPLDVCASLGSLTQEQCTMLREAGLRRYHHNLETSCAFFSSICTTHTWKERIETVDAARRAGLDVCCGGLFGLGETWEDRIDLALALRAHNIVSVPINFLTAIPGTPLAEQTPLSPEEALRIVILYRFMLPHDTIRICGGRPTILGSRQQELFRAGANGLMTGNYLTTPGFSPDDDRHLVEAEGLVVETV